MASALGLVLLASSASCGDVARLVRPGPTLVLPEVSAGVRLDDAQRHVPYSFDDVPLCLDEAGSVTVDRIELANPTGGLELRRFSVRSTEAGEYMSYLQDQRTTLTAAGYPSEGPFTVDDVCFDHREEESDDPISLLGFEVERGDESANGPAYSTGLVVHYTSGGQERSAFVGFAVLLCPGKATRRPDCDVHEVRPPD